MQQSLRLTNRRRPAKDLSARVVDGAVIHSNLRGGSVVPVLRKGAESEFAPL